MSGSVPEAVPETQPSNAGIDEEVTSPETTEGSESADAKEPEEEEEPAPKFTGPWRPKSQSDEEDSSSVDEEFEKYVLEATGDAYQAKVKRAFATQDMDMLKDATASMEPLFKDAIETDKIMRHFRKRNPDAMNTPMFPRFD